VRLSGSEAEPSCDSHIRIVRGEILIDTESGGFAGRLPAPITTKSRVSIAVYL
jgi:hypothetical protein